MDGIYDTMESEIDILTKKITSLKVADRLKQID